MTSLLQCYKNRKNKEKLAKNLENWGLIKKNQNFLQENSKKISSNKGDCYKLKNSNYL